MRVHAGEVEALRCRSYSNTIPSLHVQGDNAEDQEVHQGVVYLYAADNSVA